MSLFRNIVEKALAADLTKNEYKALLLLLSKTLGYGKAEDKLTDKRIAFLSGMRIDRSRVAVEGVLKAGLFQRERSAEYQNKYRISDELIQAENGIFFTPALPKSRRKSEKKKADSEKKRHTASNPLNNNLPQQQHTEAAPPAPVAEPSPDDVESRRRNDQELNYPESLNKAELNFAQNLLKNSQPEQAQNLLDLLALAIQQGKIKRSKTGYLKALLNAHQGGTLDDTELQKRREQQQQNQQVKQQQADPDHQLRIKQREHNVYLHDLVHRYKQFPTIEAAAEIHGKLEDIRL